MNETSISLLERLRQCADRNSWQELVELYTPMIRGWLTYRMQQADSDDLVQEILAVLVRELPHFEHNHRPGAFRNWLRTITVHRLRDFLRSQRYQLTGNSDLANKVDELADPASGLSRLWDQDHDSYLVSKLLEQIQVDFQPTTWLAFQEVMLQGMPPPRVAAQLGISVNAVLLAKSRVLRRLRQEAQGWID